MPGWVMGVAAWAAPGCSPRRASGRIAVGGREILRTGCDAAVEASGL